MNFVKFIKAARTNSLPVSVSPVLIGGILARKRDMTSVFIFACCLLTAMFLHVAANLANDYYDWLKGVDNAKSLKSPSAILTGEIKPLYFKYGFIVSAMIGIFFGILVCYFAGWFLILIGAACVFTVIAYSAGPFPLSHYALGEANAFVFFGIIPCLGTYYVLTTSLTINSVIASLICGAFAAAIMAVNNLRDIESDSLSEKKTIASILGKTKARHFTIVLVVLSMLSPLLTVISFNNLLFLCTIIPSIFYFKNLNVLPDEQRPELLNFTIENIAKVEFYFVIIFCFVLLVK